MIGIAVLGAGLAGTMQLRGWKKLPSVRVVGVHDPIADRLRAASETFGVTPFDDLDALLRAPDVDAVDIATREDSHWELARRAASCGKAVLCQKPLANSFEDACGLVQDCENAGVRIMVNENWRWRAWFRAAREVIDAGELGQLTYMHLSDRAPYAIPGPDLPAAKHANPVRRRSSEASKQRVAQKKLLLLGSGSHLLDVARYLFGDPQSVFCRRLKIADYSVGDVMQSISLGYADRIAQVDLSFASVIEPGAPHTTTLTLEGRDGTLRLTTLGEVTLVRRNGEVRPIPCDLQDWYPRSWAAPLAHFAASLEAGTPFETSGRQNLDTLRVLFEAYRSAEEGRVVELETLDASVR